MPITREQESTLNALAMIFDSVKVRQRVDVLAAAPLIADGCEQRDVHIDEPAVVATFTVAVDGTLVQQETVD